MKINAVVVLYNPKDEFLSKYQKMAEIFDKIFFIDNSTTTNNNLVKELKKINNIQYESLGENKGISYALDRGLALSSEDNPDYVLTMDQDSIYPTDRHDEVKKILENNIESDNAIITVNFNSEETSLDLRIVPWWITSGNFINMRIYKKLPQGFNVDLFIDAVDQDFCHTINKAGYKIALIPGISLIHQIGNPETHRILFKKIHTFNYPTFRYYYLFRNFYYLHKQDKKYYRKEFIKIKYFQTFKILFYEKDKKIKFRAAKLGKKDAKAGILGPCKHKLD